MARTPNFSWLKKMYQGNTAQPKPSARPRPAMMKSPRRLFFARFAVAYEGFALPALGAVAEPVFFPAEVLAAAARAASTGFNSSFRILRANRRASRPFG